MDNVLCIATGNEVTSGPGLCLRVQVPLIDAKEWEAASTQYSGKSKFGSGKILGYGSSVITIPKIVGILLWILL